jgi:hypothetical protein
MGLTGKCGFNGDLCKMLASIDAEYCPRHAFMIAQLGLEEARNVELGRQCKSCGVRFEDESVFGTCRECDMQQVCRECRRYHDCCAASEVED